MKLGNEWLSDYQEDTSDIGVTNYLPEECSRERCLENRENLKKTSFYLVFSADDLRVITAIDIDRFSNFYALLRVSAHVLLFVRNLKATVNKVERKPCSDIGTSDMNNAQRLWLQHVQKRLQLDKGF